MPKPKPKKRINFGNKRNRKTKYTVRVDLHKPGFERKFKTSRTIADETKITIEGQDKRQLKQKHKRFLEKNPYKEIKGTTKELYAKRKGIKAGKTKKPKKRKEKKRNEGSNSGKAVWPKPDFM